MPRQPHPTTWRAFLRPTRETIVQLVSPLTLFSHCESAAHVRQGLQVAAQQGQLPTAATVDCGRSLQRSNDRLEALEDQESQRRAAVAASAHLRSASVFFQQALSVADAVQPILYYYGAMSLLDFITACGVRRQGVGSAGHGLSVTCDSEGWDFDKHWARAQCRVEMGSAGDFPFYVDALTVGGWPSLFSGFRLHRETKHDLWEARRNPAPLLRKKQSLYSLCHFDLDRYLKDNPELDDWFVGANRRQIWQVTGFLLDFVIVYVASSLARYYVPARHGILEATQTSLYSDIRAAYRGVCEDIPFFFADERPFGCPRHSSIWRASWMPGHGAVWGGSCPAASTPP